MDLDEAIALQLQKEFDKESSEKISIKKKASKDGNLYSLDIPLSDDYWEIIDPNPDIHALFLQFNDKFFWSKLAGIEVRWSQRMTLCAGLCRYERRGGLCSVSLSAPLLKFRPRKDLIDTLLHEMIHAFLFVTHNFKDHDGHGPEFHKHMYRINKEAGTKITVYHTFHDEVKVYKQHWWKCNGPCSKKPPFYGMVKRSMNRKPGPYDRWFKQHQQNCDGVFIKIKEPENYKNKKTKNEAKEGSKMSQSVPTNGRNSNGNKNVSKKNEPKNQSIDKYFKGVNETKKKLLSDQNIATITSYQDRNSTSIINTTDMFSGAGLTLGTKTSNIGKKSLINTSPSKEPQKFQKQLDSFWLQKHRKRQLFNSEQESSHFTTPRPNKCSKLDDVSNNYLKVEESVPVCSKHLSTREITPTKLPVVDLTSEASSFFPCPVCFKKIEDKLMNVHLDTCLTSE